MSVCELILVVETMAPHGNHLYTCDVTFEAEFASEETLLKELTPSVWNEISWHKARLGCRIAANSHMLSSWRTCP